MLPTASRYDKNQRIRKFKQNQKTLETQNYQDQFDFSEAFAKRIKLLILEIAFDLPHIDIRREEFFFSNEHIPISRIILETGQKILEFLQTAEPYRWQYATENCLKSALENVFTLISEIMFYETGHYGETSLQLLYTYHDTRYYANVATCAAQIIDFFKEETRKIRTRNQPPPHDYPKPEPSNPRPNQDEEEDDGEIDLTNPFLAPMLGAMIRSSMQPSTSGNTRNNSNSYRIPTAQVGDLTIIHETEEFIGNSANQHRGRCLIKTGTTTDVEAIKTGTLNNGHLSENSDENTNPIIIQCGNQQFMSEYDFWHQPPAQVKQGHMKCSRHNGNLDPCFDKNQVKNENYNFAVVQTGNSQNNDEPDYQVLENLKHFMGPGLYNLADAYTNMMLLDSVVANKQFIRLFGLDRILNEGEMKAVTQESAGTVDFKYYRQTSYEKMKTIPVNMFDLAIIEDAIIAYMQAHPTSSNTPNAGESSNSSTQNTNYGSSFMIVNEHGNETGNAAAENENSDAVSEISQTLIADEMSIGDPTNENRLNNELEDGQISENAPEEQNSYESESDSPELTSGTQNFKRRKTAERLRNKARNRTLLNFEESPHGSNPAPVWNLNQNRSKSDTPRTTRNPIINQNLSLNANESNLGSN